MSCVGRRNSIGRSYLHPIFLLPANAPANSDSVRTNFWLLLTASRISTEDFAIALVDELEQPKHSRQRFTVGY
jgi:putative NADH-flavin reductase